MEPGSILLCGVAILVTAFLIFRSERKKAAVGRRYVRFVKDHIYGINNFREIQLFLIGYIIVEICEIFTVGGFPLNNTVRLVRYYLGYPVNNFD